MEYFKRVKLLSFFNSLNLKKNPAYYMYVYKTPLYIFKIF